MSTDTTALDDLDFTPSGLAVGDDVADLLFREARTVNAFADGEVTDAQLEAVHDLVRWGPTLMNTVPMRTLVVRSAEGRERLAAHMAEGNRARVLAAPLTLVVAADRDFHEHLDVLAPHLPDPHGMFPDPDAREALARSSAWLQAGYLIVGLRAAGLHVGPMAGMDATGIDAEFFADNGWRSIMVLNVGTPAGPESVRPRAPRLSWDQVSAEV
ncbi:malonic semialdehyde reductase [Cellulomonas sp. ATA003]|uniref:malonic semialdehyde reductase n=1 Tax=Cellulomonas sp. ATA003 TaxID=3073064 RepID=UPI00287379F2|nr:malonic semialdehyde reductase [Cellulomonas sp. ATA003]WNB86040.1 malonic semialdehyde reductase [Cellulomonas sp. ATA003]